MYAHCCYCCFIFLLKYIIVLGPSPVKAVADRPPSYVLTPAEEIVLCRLICTGEYCIDTIPSLEAKMKEHISPSYRDEIDFTPQVDAYVDMINFVMSVMISAVLERLDSSPFKAMRKINWATFDMIAGGDESSYVKQVRKILNECVPRLRSYITSKNYFMNFAMKLSSAVLDRFHDNVWRLKRIGMAGAAQLLLDLNTIRDYLCRLPHVGLSATDDGTASDVTAESYKISKSYLSVIYTHATKPETVLKLVCTDDDKLQETFKILWPNGSPEEYERVADLKARTGIAAPLDQVGGIIKDGAQKVGITAIGSAMNKVIPTQGITNGAKSAFGGLTGGINHMAGDMKALLGGKGLFDDFGVTTGGSVPQVKSSRAKTSPKRSVSNRLHFG